MAQITASDVNKLRQYTGAGMMDCKKALVEADGDFDKAVEAIRKKGQSLANKRADREASEGAALAKVNEDGTHGALIVLNCETDFVAKNEDFLNFANAILEVAINENPKDLDALAQCNLNGKSIADNITDQIGKIGEKLQLAYYESIDSPFVTAYIHPGNKIASLVGLSKNVDVQIGKDMAMQVAAMDPVAIDKEGVPAEEIEKEKEIGRDQARQEGKPENIIEKIAEGKLQKFFKERTLLNQDFIKESKTSVQKYLQSIDKDLNVSEFKRYSLA
ncbi:MAG: elongation factor Ts [Bacteroidetes bacterium]|jgi:elongation factor Ts|nr:elongation factor Ts [Bacteroidota bacterium]